MEGRGCSQWEPLSVCRPVVADSHYGEEQDPDTHSCEKLDQYPHYYENLDPDPHSSNSDPQPCLKSSPVVLRAEVLLEPECVLRRTM